MKNIIYTLEERGFIDAKTSEEINQLVDKPVAVYVGFDPTAESLHLGNLMGIMALAWFQRLGHKPIAIVGGATGMIGDPSGKSVERNLLDAEKLAHNLEGIGRSLKAVLKDDVTILNNYDWFKGVDFVDFLRDVGKHFRLGSMLAKDSVKTRLASDEGISFTEFSYQLLQAYDFLHLYDTHNVVLQMGEAISGATSQPALSLYARCAAQVSMVSPFLCSRAAMEKNSGNQKKGRFGSIPISCPLTISTNTSTGWLMLMCPRCCARSPFWKWRRSKRLSRGCINPATFLTRLKKDWRKR